MPPFMGKRSASGMSSSSSSASPPTSDRGAHVIHMPLSVDLDDLRLMSTACSALTPFEAVFYGGIPSIIYSIKGGRFTPGQRVNKLVDETDEEYRRNVTIGSFLNLVLTGQGGKRLSKFYGFGTLSAEEIPRMQFSLCYVNSLLMHCFQQNFLVLCTMT